MAIKFNSKEKKQENKKSSAIQVEPLPVDSVQVFHVREWENGVTFDLCLNHVISIYGCRLAATKDGNAFVSLPSRKGKDGKWYSYVFIKLDEDTNDRICQAVIDALNGEN